MHLSLMVISLFMAGMIRLCGSYQAKTWSDRWHMALGAFLLPPLLVIMTAIAVLCMGTQGHMLGLPVGWIGYSLALGFLTATGGLLLGLSWQGWRSLRQIQAHRPFNISGFSGYKLDTPALFAAQIGFWQPKLVVSEGLLNTLAAEQIQAVLTHEQAHLYYRDPFWFFWLGWIRQMTRWLPHTDALWQELLLLRELRADRWASQQVDPLLLAESLLLVVRAPLDAPPYPCVAFGAIAPPNRLEERIEALISPPVDSLSHPSIVWWMGMAVAALPLLTVMLHS